MLFNQYAFPELFAQVLQVQVAPDRKQSVIRIFYF